MFRDEEYTVKFGYMVSVAKDTSKSTSGSNGCDGCQKTIWSLGVPLKIKVFLWRVCKNQSLLVNLAKRKVPVGVRGSEIVVYCIMANLVPS
ncbi:hypothetical protein Q3G72_027268 [Acer saccharum]|nr:hypothetical protein Q3G72_027268 [Acer saccharum]